MARELIHIAENSFWKWCWFISLFIIIFLWSEIDFCVLSSFDIGFHCWLLLFRTEYTWHKSLYIKWNSLYPKSHSVQWKISSTNWVWILKCHPLKCESILITLGAYKPFLSRSMTVILIWDRKWKRDDIYMLLNYWFSSKPDNVP